ncbi:MAG: hypothetical protein G5703_08800 [Serratia symbiotica]|nr:hypothetical protein [Serratia symbiotica]
MVGADPSGLYDAAPVRERLICAVLRLAVIVVPESSNGDPIRLSLLRWDT